MAVEKRFGQGERSVLKDILPLEAPLSLIVEPSSACNFRCNYCSNSLVEKETRETLKTKIFKYELFTDLIDDLKNKGVKIKALNMARIGEPLMNKHLPEMIMYAKKSNVFDKVVTITNGSMLTPELNRKLIDAGLDRMLISIQGLTEDKYQKICGANIDFEKFRKNIEHFYHHRGDCKLYIKAFHEALDGNKEKFYELFSDICDEIYIEHIVPYTSKVDYKKIDCEFSKNRFGDDINNVDICPQSFYTLSILSNGDVSVCCLNNDNSLIVGNIIDTSILDIWNSKKLAIFRKMQVSRKRYMHPVCSKCKFPNYGINESDNIENMAENIKKYYIEKGSELK